METNRKILKGIVIGLCIVEMIIAIIMMLPRPSVKLVDINENDSIYPLDFWVDGDYRKGYINNRLDLVIPFKYCEINDFQDNCAIVAVLKKKPKVQKNSLYIPLIKYGIIDNRGNVIVSPKYDMIIGFQDDLAGVKKGDKWGFIDKKNNVVIPIEYDEIKSFDNGLAQVKKGKKWGFIDKKNNAVIPIEYDEIKSFDNGLAQIKKGKKWGFIDKSGKEVITPEYSEIKIFQDGLAQLRDSTGWVVIDKGGNKVFLYEYDSLMSIQDGLAIVKLKEKEKGWGVIDKSGKVVVDPKYDKINFKDGLVWVKNDDKWGIFDESGEIVVSPENYNQINGFSEGLASVKNSNEKWGFINRNGKEIVTPKYDNVYNYCNGLATVGLATVESTTGLKKWLYGFIDKNGNEVISPQFGSANSFDKNGLACVQKKGSYGAWCLINKNGDCITEENYTVIWQINDCQYYKVKINGNWGIIDTQGKEIISPKCQIQDNIVLRGKFFLVKNKSGKHVLFDDRGKNISEAYDEIFNFVNGFARVKNGVFWGFIDTTGKETVTPKYAEVRDFSNGFAVVKKGDLWGFIDAHGNEIVMSRYDQLLDFSKSGRAGAMIDYYNFTIDTMGNYIIK